MKNKKTVIVGISVLLVVLLLGAGFVLFLEVGKKEETTEQKVDSKYTTFGEFTSTDIFKDVPALIAEGTKIGSAFEYGDKHYTIDVNGTTLEDYQDYLELLQEAGYKKHSDNGEEGMDGYVYTASFKKGTSILNVYHIKKFEKTYISTGKNAALSDHLVYSEKYMEGVSPDAKTKVHMLELSDNGNSFVVQLKNGHFIVEDGGTEPDAPYLIDYLESLTPEGQKPVIEAWFMTHAHIDHYGALKKIMLTPDMANRIYVEGVYFVDPSAEVKEYFTKSEGNVSQAAWYIINSANNFKKQDGSQSEFYRPSLGQKYYFADITIDIPFTMDQITMDAYYSADFNDTSMWLMHNIEGQRFLHAGDAGTTSTKMAMGFYDKEYFELDMFSVLHHGINVFDYFTDYCTIKTLLYTNREVGSLYTDTKYARLEENAHLQDVVVESVAHGEGTVIMTFPYEIGSYERAKPLDWKYTNGERQHKYWDVVGGRAKDEPKE